MGFFFEMLQKYWIYIAIYPSEIFLGGPNLQEITATDLKF
jgi:hypothetical protein